MGWDELQELASLETASSQKTEQAAVAFYHLFNSDCGRQVLEAIREQTEGRTTLPAQAADGAAMALLMAVREGENNLYRWIIAMMRKGHPHA